MRNHLFVVLLSSLSLFACAGKEEAKSAADRDPWAGYTGKYSQPGGPSADKPEKAEKAEKAEAKNSKAKAEPKAEKADETPKKAASSKGTVNGESLSSISVDTLTDASKNALKGKFVSNSVVTGQQYELVQVQLKGTTVQIIRRAEKPAPNGPAIASPKAKNSELGKSDAGWYDEEADVLVFVSSTGKKGSAQKALSSLVKH